MSTSRKNCILPVTFAGLSATKRKNLRRTALRCVIGAGERQKTNSHTKKYVIFYSGIISTVGVSGLRVIMNFIGEYGDWLLLGVVCFLVLFFIGLLVVRFKTWRHSLKLEALDASIRQTLKEERTSISSEKPSVAARALYKVLSSRSGTKCLGEIANNYSESELTTLGDALKPLGYSDYLVRELDRRNEKYQTLVMRLIGLMGIHDAGLKIQFVLFHHQNNLDMQYIGLLALSLLGAERSITSLQNNPNYDPGLSFRSLSEILKSYKGNKHSLYHAALGSKDSYAHRLAIKRIGKEKMYDFAPTVCDLLHNRSIDNGTRIDAIRTLGELEYAPAKEELASYTRDKDWRVRNVAYQALGAFEDVDAKMLVVGLSDSQWWVRSNVATLLAGKPNTSEIARHVEGLNDKFASEIFASALKKHSFGQGD